MKFLPLSTPDTEVTRYSGFPTLETYIDNAKQNVADNLHLLCHTDTPNLSGPQKASLNKLQRERQSVTIKPADKNLGLVLMNTDHYITQCMVHLTDTKTYRLANGYPSNDIQRQLSKVLTNFKQQLDAFDKRLFKCLITTPNKIRTPRFYGIPKIHKQFTHLPPLRPIVSQSASPLSASAKFIDHVLQPLALQYPDHLHNSTALSLLLEDLHIPDEAILVAIDVSSLYPSIPQTECLNIIHNELHKYRHLLTFDPSLITQLLHVNINYNYFTLGQLTFQQIKGTAMGAPFSPTMANIFMSTIVKSFLRTQSIQPLLIKRYIDDIFMIWTDTLDNLGNFLTKLNTFHPNLHFTHQQSSSSIDFLDLTIYKGPFFEFTNILDTKTFQKQLNLYQYLHYSSHHTSNIFKAIITGECVRYIRTNTTRETYATIVQSFKKRLYKRGYPKPLVEKTIAIQKYYNRQNYLQQNRPRQPAPAPPLYKYLPPPQYSLLKQLILQHFMSPRFIALRHPTLGNKLVRSHLTLTDNQLVDVTLALGTKHPTSHIETATLPHHRHQNIGIKACNHPRCCTCKLHLNCSPTFKSNYPRNRTVYHVRHPFSCKSSNIIYLITCTKCKKQYIGCTSQQLNTRINHHRTSIQNRKPSYIHKHFNLPDHSISNLKVQPIDKPTKQNMSLKDLHNLEQYWINTLRTLTPYGLNSNSGTCN